MSKFYIQLWINWAWRVSLCSVILACGISSLIVFGIYLNLGSIELTKDVYLALYELFNFWFPLVWSATLLLSLFRSVKYIFNRCYSGYKFELLACGTVDVIEVIGYGDLVKVWRKWFMLLIWIVGSLMILSLVFINVFTSYTSLFEWFDIYKLFSIILISGYFSFIVINGRCKNIRVTKC